MGTPTASASINSFRLALNSSGQIVASLAGTVSGTATVETHTFGSIAAGEWTHIAVAYDSANKAVNFYLDGVLSATLNSTLDVAGLNKGSEPFAIGADKAGASDFFYGDISDVRLWNNKVRATADIANDYRSRLAYSGSVVDSTTATLALNWKLDRDPVNSINVEKTTAISTGGSNNVSGTYSAASLGAAYAATLANYLRPFADAVCPTGTVAGIYECDFRTGAPNLPTGASLSQGGYATQTIPSGLEGVYVKLWGAGGGSFKNTATLGASPGGPGGFSGANLFSIAGNTIPGNKLTLVVGDAGAAASTATYPASGAGGGGASAVTLTSITLTTPAVGLVAGGGGGAALSDALVSTLDCTSDASGVYGTNNQCGLGGGGGGVGAPAAPVQAPDDNLFTCGGLGGTTALASFGSNPPSLLCDFGGQSPSAGIGGGGSGSAGGNSYALVGGSCPTLVGGVCSGAATTHYDAATGGAGTLALGTQGGAGGGGAGGGINALDGSFHALTGGGGAGGYGLVGQDGVAIAGTPTTGYPVKLSFTNPTATATYTVQVGDTLTKIAQGLASNAALTGINNLVVLQTAGISAATVTTPTITLIQDGVQTPATVVTGTPELIIPPSATMAGGGLGSPATATITLSGSVQSGDVISITIGGNTPYTHTVGAGDTNIPTLAANIVTEISNPILGLLGLGYTASNTGGAITISYSLLGTGVLGNGIVITSTVNGMTVSVTPSSSAFTPIATTNGYGGGGGAGYVDSAALSSTGQVSPPNLLGVPANATAFATATISTAGATAGDTIALKITGTTLNNYSTAVYTAVGGETATTLASKLVAIINKDTTLQTNGIFATSSGATVTVRQIGTKAVANTTVFTLVITGTETVSYSPPNAANTAAQLVGFDIYYAPSYVSYSPGVGGIATTNGNDGHLGDGNSGAAVILW